MERTVEGRLVAVPFSCPGGRLMLNADALARGGPDYGSRPGAGYVLCAVLDGDGREIEGYGRDDFVRFWKDARKGVPCRWGERRSLDELAGRTIRLGFHLLEADLYSFWFEPGANAAGTDALIEKAHVE